MDALEDFKFDFMPRKRNVVYHVVSTDWFKAWQTYVGITADEKIEDQEMQSETKVQEDAVVTEQQQVKATFKNLNKQMIK
jgi:hypothetical protein